MTKEQIKKIIIDYIVNNKYDIIGEHINHELFDYPSDNIEEGELEEMSIQIESEFLFKFDDIIKEMKK